MASSITRFVTFPVYRFLMDFPTGFLSMTRFVAVVTSYSRFLIISPLVDEGPACISINND